MLRRSVLNYASVMAGLNVALLLAILTSLLTAQRSRESVPPKGPAPAYDAAHEFAFDGTIQAVVTHHEAGSPAGLHLIVSGDMGRVDAHLGPFLTQETRDALHMGLSLHVVGAMKDFHGKPILLARLISFGGRTVIVRSLHGALVLYPTRPTTVTPRSTESANGGGR